MCYLFQYVLWLWLQLVTTANITKQQSMWSELWISFHCFTTKCTSAWKTYTYIVNIKLIRLIYFSKLIIPLRRTFLFFSSQCVTVSLTFDWQRCNRDNLRLVIKFPQATVFKVSGATRTAFDYSPLHSCLILHYISDQ